MPVIVRRFEKDEWRAYRDLRLQALADAPDSFGSTYGNEVTRTDADWQHRLHDGATSPDQLPLVAIVDDAPIGLAWARRDEHDSTLAHLFQVWVASQHRGLGIGRLLTDAVIVWARDLGIRAVRLGVTQAHPAAVRLYRRAGFVNAGEAGPLRAGSSIRSQPMQLTLQPASQIGRANER